jgi:4-amino-4-deoxy-L-arabinose transferase-like glycosyltransferase
VSARYLGIRWGGIPILPGRVGISKPGTFLGRLNNSPLRSEGSLAPAKRVLLGILILTAALRTIHLVDHLSSGLNEPESVVAESDMRSFSVWASRIAEGDLLSVDTYHPYPSWMVDVAPLETFERWWGGRETFHQTPLYAYLLAISYWLTGGKLLLLAVQVMCSTLSVYLIYRIGSRIADEKAGLLAAALAAVYAPSVFLDTMLLRASLTASLTLVSIWLLMRVRDTGRLRTALGAGIVLGAGFLMRPVGLALLAGPLVLLLDSKARPAWRRWMPSLVAGIAIILAPFVVRNIIVGAPALSFSNRGPEAMIQGNHAGADPAFMMLSTDAQYRQMMEEGGGSVRRTLLAAIRTWPEDGRVGWWVWHEARKLLAVFRDYEYANNTNFYFYRRATPLLAVLPTFGLICGLGLVGTVLLFMRGRDRTAALLLGLAASGLIGIMLLALATGRYRLPLAMLCTLPAGVTLSALWDWLAAKRWTPALVCSAAVVALSTVSYRAVPTRVIFDSDRQARFIRGPDARLYEELEALRVWEFAEEARLLTQRGETEAARSLLTGYLAEVRQTISGAPAGEDLNLRRRILTQTYAQLFAARDLFTGIGLDDFAQSVGAELDWIQANG